MKDQKPSFTAYLNAFSVHELPVTLTQESLSDFEKLNDPLPSGLIEAFIEQPGEDAEFIDHVPCFRIPETHDFHAVVFWRGALLKYQYFLVTYDKKGNQLSSAIIAGMEANSESVIRSIATIEKDWIIHVVEGERPVDDEHYQPTATKAYKMELLATGEVIMLETPK